MNKKAKEKGLAILCAALITCTTIPVMANAAGNTKETTTLNEHSENALEVTSDNKDPEQKTVVVEGNDTLYSDSSCEHETSSIQNGKPTSDIMKKSAGVNKHGVSFSLKNGSIIEKENEIRYWRVHKGTLYINHAGKLTQSKIDQDSLHFVNDKGDRVSPINIADKLIIGKDVTSIGSNAFEGWDISSVSFEKGSKCSSIGSSAFRDCYILKKASVPKSVKTIGAYAFRNCHEKLKVSYESPAATSVAATAYQKDTSKVSAMAKKCLKVKAKALGKKKIEVSWNKVSGAKKYAVYYKRSAAKSYKKKTVTPKRGKTQRIVLKNLKKGQLYSSYVIAFKSTKVTSKNAIVKSTESKNVKAK